MFVKGRGAQVLHLKSRPLKVGEMRVYWLFFSVVDGAKLLPVLATLRSQPFGTKKAGLNFFPCSPYL